MNSRNSINSVSNSFFLFTYFSIMKSIISIIELQSHRNCYFFVLPNDLEMKASRLKRHIPNNFFLERLHKFNLWVKFLVPPLYTFINFDIFGYLAALRPGLIFYNSRISLKDGSILRTLIRIYYPIFFSGRKSLIPRINE